MLSKLLSAMDPGLIESRVLSLTSLGAVGPLMQERGVRVDALGLSRGIPDPRALFRVARCLRAWKPDLIHTWMYHADLIGGLSARIAWPAPVVWCVRHGHPDSSTDKLTTIATARACSLLSRILPRKIIFCSEESRRNHQRLGYAGDRATVIPNGFNIDEFRPRPEERARLRVELDLPPETEIIGCVARFDPIKDHPTLLRAARILLMSRPGARMLLCGRDVTWENARLVSWLREAGLARSFVLMGQRRDVSRILPALDLVTLSSVIEGFPNVIGEAMAAGIPCVVTDVGDSAYLLGDTGRVVPPRQPEALAAAWLSLLEAGPEVRRRLGAQARTRIEQNFTLEVVTRKYSQVYLDLARNPRPSTPSSAIARSEKPVELKR